MHINPFEKILELKTRIHELEDGRIQQSVYMSELEEKIEFLIDSLREIANEDYRGHRSRLSIIAIEALKQVGVEYENLQIK